MSVRMHKTRNRFLYMFIAYVKNWLFSKKGLICRKTVLYLAQITGTPVNNEITVKLKDIEARNQSVACPRRSNVADGMQKVLPPKWYGF